MDLICFFLSFADINQLLEVMRERKLARTKVSEGVLPQYGEMGTALKNVSNFFLFFAKHTEILVVNAYFVFSHKKKCDAQLFTMGFF
jgi:hypothetical protein